MKIINATSPRYDAHGNITIDVEFDGIGVVPFGASPNDVEPHGRDLYARAVAGEFGPVAAYVAPAPVTPTTVTMRQAQRALYDAGLLANVESAIASFPGALGDKARIDWRTAQEVKRSDPIVQALIPSLGLTEPQLDALFTAAAAIQ